MEGAGTRRMLPALKDLCTVFWKHPIGSVSHQSPALAQVVADSLTHGLVLVSSVNWEVTMFGHGLRVQSQLLTNLPQLGLWCISNDLLMDFHDAQ